MAEIKIDETLTKFDKKPVVNAWGFRSPLMIGDTFSVQIRVKVFDGMDLEGATIKVVDSKTGKVLASTREGKSEDTIASMLQQEVTLDVPTEAGMHKYFAVLDMGGDDIPAQAPIAFSVVPRGDRTITITCRDDKSGKPVPSRIFLYNNELEKVHPIDVRANADGVAQAKIIAGDSYRAEAVCEDYVTSFLDISEDPTETAFDLPMRYIFNVKIKRPFG